MSDRAPADWYPDPSGRFDHRYWDGQQWTRHVASNGKQATAPLEDNYSAATASRVSAKVQKQVRRAGIVDSAPSTETALLTEHVLVVEQRGKLLEINAEYVVYDRTGRQIGSVREVGQSFAKKALAPANRTRRLQILDAHGDVLLALTQPTQWVNAKMLVIGAEGEQIGQIAQKFTFHHSRFRLESNGEVLGSILGENHRQSDFSIQDRAGGEIGRITRTSAGLGKELFTRADSYVVEIHRRLDEPLRSLVIAAALAVDTALRQM